MSKLPPGYIPMTHHQFNSSTGGMNGNGRSGQSDSSGGRSGGGRSSSSKSRSSGSGGRRNNNTRNKRRRPKNVESESAE